MNDEIQDPDQGKRQAGFVPDVLDSSVIAFPLMERLKKEPNRLQPIVIDLNLNYPGGREEARARVTMLIDQVTKPGVNRQPTSDSGSQYVFATLDAEAIKAIVRLDRETAGDSPTQRAIFHVWPDFEIHALT
jgi:serine protease AprX